MQAKRRRIENGKATRFFLGPRTCNARLQKRTPRRRSRKNIDRTNGTRSAPPQPCLAAGSTLQHRHEHGWLPKPKLHMPVHPLPQAPEAARTFHALARASICGAEKAEVPTRVSRAGLAGRLSGLLLIEVSKKNVAVDAAKLANFGLEEPCSHENAESGVRAPSRHASGRSKQCSRRAVGGDSAELAIPAEHNVHALTAPPMEPDPDGQGKHVDSFTA